MVKEELKNSKNRYIITVTALVDAIHQSMLSSCSGYFNLSIVNFHIVMEIDWDNVGTYISTAALTYKKVSFCGYLLVHQVVVTQ